MLHFECKCCIECPSRASDPNYYYCYCYWCANDDVQMSNSTLINYIPQPFLSNRFESMSRSMCRFSFPQQSCVLHHCVQQVCQNIWIRAKNPNLARAQTLKMKKKNQKLFSKFGHEGSNNFTGDLNSKNVCIFYCFLFIFLRKDNRINPKHSMDLNINTVEWNASRMQVEWRCSTTFWQRSSIGQQMS